MKIDCIKSIILILLGFLTIPLLEILPVAGGGASLIIVITIPFLLLVSLIMTMVYSLYYNKKKNEKTKRRAFVIMALTLIALNLLLFPHR
ncbi:hypothetical protein [Winogradskyella sp. SYSU M77433]|uniref:hypothetical protein n=1 Tax=Winogradskyella sp. SYSU M77433 TaxID=3042722 RepID=UPI0024806750|nr:hypothetical protein [Winogradskyella sp. SYSU M77433]MDH7911780.1 hypothetical protein [Winogradskyella sp. SYSU M77433]